MAAVRRAVSVGVGIDGRAPGFTRYSSYAAIAGTDLSL